MPNLLLAAIPYLPPETLQPPDDVADDESVVPDLYQPGDLNITFRLKEAFRDLLNEREVELRFTYGHWAGLASDLQKEDSGYGLVMTAETIYAEASVDTLLEVLRSASSRSKKEKKMGEEVELEERLKVRDDWAKLPLRVGKEGVVLVAAKVFPWSFHLAITTRDTVV